MRRLLVVLPLLTLTATLDAQVRVIAGRVVDRHTEQPVADGEVLVKGGSLSDRLRPDGVFILRIRAAGRVTLVVRAPGYQEREIVVLPHQPAVEVSLVREQTPTNELVGEDFTRVPSSTVEQAIQGKVPGVSAMSNSGAPADIQLQLRGVTTILGNGRPLWVLDDVIVSDVGPASGQTTVVGGPVILPSRIADLNPHDIASIEVLRSASASAMYGSRGGNGVILIRTKRGRRR